MVETVGRVFAAAPLPPEIRMALADRVSKLDIPGKLAPTENWHITLRFLGVVDELTYERFLGGLSDVGRTKVFRVHLSGFGAFPRASRANVVWVGLDDGSAQLGVLNEMAEEAATDAGLTGEERPFHPHVTLSRVRPPADARHLEKEPLDLGWACDRLVVYRSHLGGGPARYEPLESLWFTG
jgi:2'-5' RNA ligase